MVSTSRSHLSQASSNGRMFTQDGCDNAYCGRLFTNERRFRRNLTDSDSCPFCTSTESTSHMLLHCSIAADAWLTVDSLNINPAECSSIKDMPGLQPPCKIRNTVIMAILWSLWKRRNAKVFRNDEESLGSFDVRLKTYFFGPVDVLVRIESKFYLIGESCCPS